MTTSFQLEQFRAVRRLGTPDAPAESTLVTREDDMFLLVDIADDSLTDAWPFVDATHVWAPLDVVRRTDGHDALMPRAAEELLAFLFRRASGTIGAGEVVTLACSVLRGLTEVREHTNIGDPAPQATWWITDDGRPLLVLGGSDSADESSAVVCDVLAEGAPPQLHRAIAAAAAACRAHGEDSLIDPEVQLCAIAAPQPVTISLIGARTDPFAHIDAAAARRARAAGARKKAAEQGRTTEPSRLAAVLGRVRETVLSWRERRSRPRPDEPPGDKPPRSRKKLVLFALGLVIVIVAVAALLPNDQKPAPPPATVVPETPAQGAESPAPLPAEPAPAPESVAVAQSTPATDVVAAATAVLAAARSCGSACSGVAVNADAVTQVPAEGEVALVDDYGGVAVVTMKTGGDAGTLVVIEQHGERWLIRDIIRNAG